MFTNVLYLTVHGINHNCARWSGSIGAENKKKPARDLIQKTYSTIYPALILVHGTAANPMRRQTL